MSFLGWLEHSDSIIFVGEIALSKIRCRALGEKMSKIFLLYANKTKFYFFSEGPLYKASTYQPNSVERDSFF